MANHGMPVKQSEGIAIEGKLKRQDMNLFLWGTANGVINTCTVTNEADAKSRNAIRRFSRKNPNATTVVVGCYSQISANEVAMVDGVDYVIGNHDKLNFLNYLSEEKPETPVVVRERLDREDFSIGLVGEAKFEQRANLKIQDGCDFMCSFCIIPFAEGGLVQGIGVICLQMPNKCLGRSEGGANWSQPGYLSIGRSGFMEMIEGLSNCLS